MTLCGEFKVLPERNRFAFDRLAHKYSIKNEIADNNTGHKEKESRIRCQLSGFRYYRIRCDRLCHKPEKPRHKKTTENRQDNTFGRCFSTTCRKFPVSQ